MKPLYEQLEDLPTFEKTDPEITLIRAALDEDIRRGRTMSGVSL